MVLPNVCSKPHQIAQQCERTPTFPAITPLESVATDLLRKLIGTPRGTRYLLVISHIFTKLVKTVPMKTDSAAGVSKHFANQWAFNYGPPCELLSDNGSSLPSKLFQDVRKLLNVWNVFTTRYHPQTNGHVERYNRTIIAL